MGEMLHLFQVWIFAIICLTYCYSISARISAGLPRLVSLLPIFYLFIILPFQLSTIHLCSFTAFLLAWLANFKLILFAFDEGPLVPTPQKLSHFIAIASLPISIKINKKIKSNNSQASEAMGLAIKVVLFGMLVQGYNYKKYCHQNIARVIYGLHIYLFLEIVFTMCAVIVRAIFGWEIEPQFNQPYLASSLQDFWGRRWNLVVSRILRSTVYNPIRRISTPVIGLKWAPLPAVFGTFVMSGFMHEMIYCYLTRAPPTWEMTFFFMFHGTCLIVEVVAKRALTDGWQLHRAVSGLLLLCFFVVTSVWLFLPLLLRNGLTERMMRESVIVSNFVKESIRFCFPAVFGMKKLS